MLALLVALRFGAGDAFVAVGGIVLLAASLAALHALLAMAAAFHVLLVALLATV